MTFRWPTPITDSDDDLKSELTELTYISPTNNKTIPMETYDTIECINSENPSNISLKNEEKCNCSSHSFQKCKENTLFVKPLVSNSKEDITPIPQTRNMELAHDEKKQNIELDVNPLFSEISSRVMNKLKDIIREDKLHMIINNLVDKNCSPKYIDKIIELFECSDYIVSYRAKSECNDDSAVFVNCGMSSKLETIPLQTNLSCNDNHININKFKDGIMEQSKNYMRSTDLKCGGVKNDSIQSSNSMNITPKHNNNNDSDESESETYGVPKISEVNRILHAQKASKKMYKHKVRKKLANPQCNAKEIEHKFEPAHVAIPITNNNKSVSDESDISITEDETKARRCHEIINIAQKSQKDTFYRHHGIRKNNFDVHDANKLVVQNEQSLDALEAQRVNLNVFVKERKTPHTVQENAHTQFVTDIDYTTNSDIDVSANKQKKDGNMIGLHSNLGQEIVINSKSNNNFSENPLVLRELRREFIEQPKSETVKAKPNIISSMPVNLKLKIKKADSKSEQLQASNVIIVENEEHKQYSNIQPSEEVQKKKSVLKSSTQMAANDKICPTNKQNESNINPINLKLTMINPTIEQSKNNEFKVENNRKMLCAWMPKVIYHAKSKFELGLIFEGKLLK